MFVFTVFAAVSAQFLLGTLSVQKGNTQRVAAANLAAQQVELVRGTPVLELADGVTTLPFQPALAGTTYTLTQDVGFVAGQSGGSVCSSTSNSLTYKKISVTVTWPNMGNIKPVRSDTVKVLGLGPNEADVRKGAAAVGVLDNTGAPQPGVLITLAPTGRSATTGADGCAVFPNLVTTTTHTATLSKAGYVDPQGDPSPARAINVDAGKVARTSLSYAQSGAVQVTLKAPPGGYDPPTGLGLTLDASILTPTTSRAFPLCAGASAQPCATSNGVTRLAGGLFPATYSGWGGTCSDAKPASVSSTAITAGALGNIEAELGALQVDFTGGNRNVDQLYAVHAPGGSCQAGEVWPVSRISDGDRRVALPPGVWDLALRADGSDAGTYDGVPRYTVVAGAVTTASL